MAAVLVQSSGALSGGGTTQGHTWAVAPTVGNLIIAVAVGWNGTLAPTISCSDSASNTYSSRSTGTNTTTRVSILDAVVGTSPTTSTIAFSVAADHSVVFMEWSGLTASAFDTSATANGPAGGGGAHTLTVGPTATLAQASELIITGLGAATGLSNSLISAPSGYTGVAFEQNSPSFIGMGSAYQTVASTAAVSAGWPWSSAGGTGEVAAAVIATYRLTVSTSLTPSAGSVSLSGPVPTVARTANQALAPTNGAVTLSGLVPTVARTTNQALTPSVGAIALTGPVPTVSQTAGTALVPGSMAVTLTGPVPLVVRTANQALAPNTGALVLTGQVPVVTQASASASFVPSTAALTITGYAPGVQQLSGVVLLGGGPGGPRKRARGGTESYLERLLGRPLDEEPEPQDLQIIERAVQVAARAPESPTRSEAADALKLYGVAFQEAYIQMYQELEAKRRQELEDEQIAAIVALCL